VPFDAIMPHISGATGDDCRTMAKFCLTAALKTQLKTTTSPDPFNKPLAALSRFTAGQ
jgi:hypothetical protein